MQKPYKNLLSYVLFLLLCLPSLVVADQIIRMATTTSTDNSGLLEHLLPAFTQKSGYEVHVIAVGTGKALKMGEAGDVDVVLVHAKTAEQAFVEKGFGINRKEVMYNDFVVVGPKQDPAKIQSADNIVTAFKNISVARTAFISRGDNSGTHKKEMTLWKAAKLTPKGAWYQEAGQGMGKILQIAAELDAYTLSDQGTWLAYRNKSSLSLLYSGDKRLYNPYGIIAVNPKRYPDINYKGAMTLIHWLTSVKGQKMIANFTLHGEHPFVPSANNLSAVNN